MWFLSRGFITFKQQKTQSLYHKSWTIHHSGYRTPWQHSWYLSWVLQDKVHAITSLNPRNPDPQTIPGQIGQGLLAGPKCQWHEMTLVGVVQFSPCRTKGAHALGTALSRWALHLSDTPRFSLPPAPKFPYCNLSINSNVIPTCKWQIVFPNLQQHFRFLDIYHALWSSLWSQLFHCLSCSVSPHAESSSVFSYPPSLHPTQHHWQKPKLKSSSVLHVLPQLGNHMRD